MTSFYRIGVVFFILCFLFGCEKEDKHRPELKAERIKVESPKKSISLNDGRNLFAMRSKCTTPFHNTPLKQIKLVGVISVNDKHYGVFSNIEGKVHLFKVGDCVDASGGKVIAIGMEQVALQVGNDVHVMKLFKVKAS